MKAASLFFILLQSASAARRLRSHRKLVQSTDPTIKIDQEYIVIFDDQVDVVAKMTSIWEGLDGNSEILFTYTDDLKGLSLKMLPDASLWNILEDDDVQFVEEVGLQIQVPLCKKGWSMHSQVCLFLGVNLATVNRIKL